MWKGSGQLRPMVYYGLNLLGTGSWFWLIGSVMILLLLKIESAFLSIVPKPSTYDIYLATGLIVLLSVATLYYQRLRVTLLLVKKGLTWEEAEFAVFEKALHKYYKFQDMSLEDIRNKISFWQ